MKGKIVTLLAMLGLFAVLLFVASCSRKPAAGGPAGSEQGAGGAGSASSSGQQGMSGMSAAEHEAMKGESGGGHGGGEASGEGGGHGGGHEKQTPIEEIEDVPPLTTGSPVKVEFPGVKIEPRVIRLKAGEITFLVTNNDNEGGRSHNFRIARWKDGARPARGEIIEPGPWMGPGGKKREFTVRLEPGTYYVYCAQADHEESGMTGKIIVEP